MERKPVFRRFYFPLSLVAVHAVLMGFAFHVGSVSGWDDPLVVLLEFLDYPAAVLLDLTYPAWIELSHIPRRTILIATTGVYWFCIGLLLQLAFNLVRKRLSTKDQTA